MSAFQSFWSFASVVIIAWITQRIVAYWEKKKKVEEIKLSLYISWMPFFAECYAKAVEPNITPHNNSEFLKRKMEILGILQIMGPESAMDAFCDFCDLAEKSFSNDPSFDKKAFHTSFTHLNYSLCCEIHGEKHEQPVERG